MGGEDVKTKDHSLDTNKMALFFACLLPIVWISLVIFNHDVDIDIY